MAYRETIRAVALSTALVALAFRACNAGTLTYDIESIDRQGLVPVERVALDKVPLCYLLNTGREP